jgi:glycerol-3-phosphate acyltransferase PlsY
VWSKWIIAGWAFLSALVVGYELWTNFNGSPKTPTLTDVTIRYMPWWIILPFLTWLLLHFAVNYAYASKLLRTVIQ